MTMTPEQKEARKRRVIPLLQLMIADGKHTLAVKNLVLDLMTAESLDANAAYDRLMDITKERDAEEKKQLAAVMHMLFRETLAVEEAKKALGLTFRQPERDFEQWKMNHMFRRARERRKTNEAAA